MSGFRWGTIFAIAAFFISMGMGIISGAGAFHIILIRAIIFAVVFFGLGFGLRFMINSFFPEIFYGGDETAAYGIPDESDPHDEIIIDSTGEYAVPELFKTLGDPNELGNIEDLISGSFKPRPEGVDRKPEEGYNNIGKVQSAVGDENGDFLDTAVFEKTPVEKPAFTPSFGDEDTGLGGLPDLDSMAVAFSNAEEAQSSPAQWSGGASEMPSIGGEDDFLGSVPDVTSMDQFQPQQTADFEQVRTAGAENKPMPLKGGFKPKELAEGIRTVLSKDQ